MMVMPPPEAAIKMFFLILMPALLLAFVACAAWLGARAARLARDMARRQQASGPPYPTVWMMEATHEPPPEGVWPPTPEVLPPETQPREHNS